MGRPSSAANMSLNLRKYCSYLTDRHCRSYIAAHENEWQYSLVVRHSIPAIVHHVSEEDNCVRVTSYRRAPALANVQVDDELAQSLQPRGAVRVRVTVGNLGVGDYEYMGRVLDSMHSCFNEFSLDVSRRERTKVAKCSSGHGQLAVW